MPKKTRQVKEKSLKVAIVMTMTTSNYQRGKDTKSQLAIVMMTTILLQRQQNLQHPKVGFNNSVHTCKIHR